MKNTRYMKRLRAISILVLIIILIGVIIGKVVSNERKPILIEVGPVQTLWTTAEEYCPNDMRMRKYIEYMKKLNQMKDSRVYADREYLIPIFE